MKTPNRSNRIARLPLITAGLALLTPALLTAQIDPALRIQRDGPNNLMLDFNGQGILEEGPTPDGPFNPVLDVQQQAQKPIDAQRRFFRVRTPLDPRGNVIPVISSPAGGMPVVKSAAVTQLGASTQEGNSRLEVTFEPRPQGTPPLPPTLEFLYDNYLGIFRDDGTNGDRNANDRIYTTTVSVTREELAAMNAYNAQFPANQRQAPVFRGRTVTGTVPSSFIDLQKFLEREPVQIYPFHAGVRSASSGLAGRTGGGVIPVIDPEKSLLIRDLSVVEDPTRTFDPCTGVGTPMGAWTFGKLMSDMANTPATGIPASEFVRRWLRTWMTDQVVNFDTVAQRAAIAAQIVTPWQAASGGPGMPLDLSKAPFRLCAIINRVDLRGNLSYGGGGSGDPCNPTCEAGEARFVFCAVDGACNPLPFLVILEYCVPRRGCRMIKDWGCKWAALSGMAFGPAFNAQLQALTDEFAGANADPSRLPNKSAISQIRTNEIALAGPWELREWRIFPNDSDAGYLREVTVKQTPAWDHNFTTRLADYGNFNSPALLGGTHTIPLEWMIAPPAPAPTVPFLGGGSPMPGPGLPGGSLGTFWDGPAPIGSSIMPGTDTRFNLSLNTCSGCHHGETATVGGPFSSTRFVHVDCRSAGNVAAISSFLTGVTPGAPAAPAGTTPVPPPHPALSGAPASEPNRIFWDLGRRSQDLALLCTTPCFFTALLSPTLVASH